MTESIRLLVTATWNIRFVFILNKWRAKLNAINTISPFNILYDELSEIYEYKSYPEVKIQNYQF